MNDLKSSPESTPNKNRSRRLAKACLLSLPMILLTSLMILGQSKQLDDPKKIIALSITYVFLNALFFLMLYSGKTYKYRRVFFVALALMFAISFTTNLVDTRGSMAITRANMIEGDTPFCHMVIPMIIIPAALTRTVIFPGSLLGAHAAIASMLVIWIGASLALGRGWCGWACFFGGFDEGFSCVLKKPVVKKINNQWTYLPYAILLVVVLTAAATLTPTYCEWLCPFKTVTEFAKVDSPLVAVQTVIFLLLFFGLVVALPILSKRRAQCGLFCPMGAFQSFTNYFNVFDVRIDREKCVDCGRCIALCPTFSLNDAVVEKGRARITCVKCGRCVDECRKGAAAFHVRGTNIGIRRELARILFLYPAYLFGATFGMSMISGGLWRIIKLLTTGSVL